MRDQKPENLIIKHAQLRGGPYKNFSGAASQKSPEGKRTICVVLDEETAAALLEEGWNVKTTNAKEGYEPTTYLKVNVSYAFGEPNIEVFDNEDYENGVFFNERMVGKLDRARIKYVDLNISPSSKKYEHPDGSPATYAAYLESMNVVTECDPIAAMRRSADEYEE